MRKVNLSFFIMILMSIYSLNIFSQTGFHFDADTKNKQRIDFKLINNLIVIPLEINGEILSFILDTGANKTILFSPSPKDSIQFQNLNSNMLRGLGIGESVKAIISKNNTIKIQNLYSTDETIFVTLDNPFDFSRKMGTTIHGIIGYNLFKDLVVKINYKSQKITFYSKDHGLKKCRKCVEKSIFLSGNKPYINAQISLDTVKDNFKDVKLLIDSGGSDTVWLFENKEKEISTPNLFFKDILGEGISGHVYGNRSRVEKFKLGHFEMEKPTVSFLDSTSVHIAKKFRDRDGSIGGRILKKFIVWLDYSNKKVILKKNGVLSGDFNYNMSGLDVVYNGTKLVKQRELVDSRSSDDKSNLSPIVLQYTYKFKPSYLVNNVLRNSPAYIAGLLKGDVILEINNKDVHNFTLSDIFFKFQEKDNKKIKMVIDRNGQELKFEFRLKKRV